MLPSSCVVLHACIDSPRDHRTGGRVQAGELRSMEDRPQRTNTQFRYRRYRALAAPVPVSTAVIAVHSLAVPTVRVHTRTRRVT